MTNFDIYKLAVKRTLMLTDAADWDNLALYETINSAAAYAIGQAAIEINPTEELVIDLIEEFLEKAI